MGPATITVRFIMPGPAKEPLADSPWYSFDFGPVHFTVISTEHNFSRGSKQVGGGGDPFSNISLIIPPIFLPKFTVVWDLALLKVRNCNAEHEQTPPCLSFRSELVNPFL